MNQSFKLFPQLPPEIRQQIWRITLTQDWEYTTFKRDGRRIKIVGKINLAVRQACREARSMMKLVLTKEELSPPTGYQHDHIFLGWFNYDRHLFFFGDIGTDRGLMMDLLKKGILNRVQHIAINPFYTWSLMETIQAIKPYCTSVRTLVVVGDHDVTAGQTFMTCGPRTPLFRNSPRELYLSELLGDINAQRPDIPSINMSRRPKIQRALDKFPCGTPLLLMRSIYDLEAQRVN
ncbi:hypothetical protein K449DRAFT_401377 [Hypoxylon sp. EC38]|nr:hypothetical protein K449DRAFT_401377 [Hypoxylon sp. EC38]